MAGFSLSVCFSQNYSGFLSQSFIFQYDHDNDVISY